MTIVMRKTAPCTVFQHTYICVCVYLKTCSYTRTHTHTNRNEIGVQQARTCSICYIDIWSFTRKSERMLGRNVKEPQAPPSPAALGWDGRGPAAQAQAMRSMTGCSAPKRCSPLDSTRQSRRRGGQRGARHPESRSKHHNGRGKARRQQRWAPQARWASGGGFCSLSDRDICEQQIFHMIENVKMNAFIPEWPCIQA